MTFDLRKFERVWEKAGERPEELIGFFECETGLVPGKGPKAVFPRVAFIDPAGCRISTCVSHDLAAAIIHDWAVGWLTSRTEREILISGHEQGCISIDEWGDHEMGPNIARGEPTEALYRACCKVLGIEP